MDFLTDLFTALNTRDSLLVLLFLLIAFLIGLITGWLYWRGRLADLRTELTGTKNHLQQVSHELDDLRVKLTNTEEDLHRANMDADDLRKRLRTCEEEKGQLRAEIYQLTGEVEAGGQTDRQALLADLGASIAKADAADKDDLKLISGVGPAIERKLNELGIYTFAQVSAFDADTVEKVNTAIAFFPGRIARDNWVGQARELMRRKQTDPASLAPQVGAPGKVDDLKVVEGIGPKIEQLLKNGGIGNWAELAVAPVARLQEILDAAGDRYRIHNPETWPQQAALLVKEDWTGFREYTDYLKGGRDPGATS